MREATNAGGHQCGRPPIREAANAENVKVSRVDIFLTDLRYRKWSSEVNAILGLISIYQVICPIVPLHEIPSKLAQRYTVRALLIRSQSTQRKDFYTAVISAYGGTPNKNMSLGHK